MSNAFGAWLDGLFGTREKQSFKKKPIPGRHSWYAPQGDYCKRRTNERDFMTNGKKIMDRWPAKVAHRYPTRDEAAKIFGWAI